MVSGDDDCMGKYRDVGRSRSECSPRFAGRENVLAGPALSAVSHFATTVSGHAYCRSVLSVRLSGRRIGYCAHRGLIDANTGDP